MYCKHYSFIWNSNLTKHLVLLFAKSDNPILGQIFRFFFSSSFFKPINSCLGLPRWLSSKEFTCWCSKHRFHSWVGKILWRRKWPEKSHGQKSLAGYSFWGPKSWTPLWLSMSRNTCLEYKSFSAFPKIQTYVKIRCVSFAWMNVTQLNPSA